MSLTSRWIPAAILALSMGAPSGGTAQPALEVDALAGSLERAREAHLDRVAVWGGASLLAGLALIASARGGSAPGRMGFGIQTGAWGLINLGIVGVARATAAPVPGPGLAAVLAAEDAWGNTLLVNLGLNVGYIAVGAALAVAAGRGLRSGPSVRGHGLGVVVQGLGLLALDGLAYAGSRSRMEALQGLVERLEPAGDSGSLSIVLVSLPF